MTSKTATATRTGGEIGLKACQIGLLCPHRCPLNALALDGWTL